MAIRVFNTLSREIEEFVPAREGFAGMYLCGPTVYGEAHLGNARTAVAFDVVRRWLRYRGLRVRFVSNVTDVGHITEGELDEGRDRIGERAARERVEPIEIADRFFWKYFDEMAKLNVLRPDITPRASGHIVEQIALVEELLARGHAYEADGSVYFAVAGWPGYGSLSRQSIDQLAVGTRALVAGQKRDPRDFAVWKRADPGHVQRWPSPWGEGFPGWHLECSAMGLKYLGEGFDIHAGGLDLAFPHHEAEIAQAEGAGHRFARYWLHGNMLTVDGEKMSRSRGNFTTLAAFFAEHDPMLLRFLFVEKHYRSLAEVSAETRGAGRAGLERLRTTRRTLADRIRRAPAGQDAALDTRTQAARAEFEDAMDDDFDSPRALASLFGFARHVNGALDAPRQSLEGAARLLDDLGEGVLGLFPESATDAGASERLAAVMALLLEARAGYRAGRDFARADELRRRLEEAGIDIEDGREGTSWRLLA